jgi:hypothetical protein
MGEYACKDRSQCWEPCDELGHSEEHAQITVVGPSGSDWELVGYFLEEGGRWTKMDNIYADDPDAVALYRKRSV